MVLRSLLGIIPRSEVLHLCPLSGFCQESCGALVWWWCLRGVWKGGLLQILGGFQLKWSQSEGWVRVAMFSGG
jgi:hypothetical protein